MNRFDARLIDAIMELNALMCDETTPWSVLNQALNKLIRAARAARAMRRLEAVSAAKAQSP